ncbi:MAG: hypothetical protein ACREMA_04380 [Longimicrobiales bacterium]
MLTRCIFCHRPFPANQQIRHLPAGERIAFDPQRGRLWCICGSCQGWTLMPIEQRWEALEELERVVKDRARLLLQGENIALYRMDRLELIRIGRAGLPEQAWWRYGDELARRHDRSRRIKRRGKIIDALAAMAIVGVPIWSNANAERWVNSARHKSMGNLAWNGSERCASCNREIRKLPFALRSEVQVLGALESVSLRIPCSCGNAGTLIGGLPACHTLRRLLAYHNYSGASQPDITHAATLVENPARRDPLGALLGPDRTIVGLDHVRALTLEIACNHAVEREWLQLEANELEARWREEEAIADIADGELA